MRERKKKNFASNRPLKVAIFVAGEDEDYSGDKLSKEFLRYHNWFIQRGISLLTLNKDRTEFGGQGGFVAPHRLRQDAGVEAEDKFTQGIRYLLYPASSQCVVIAVEKNAYLRGITDTVKNNTCGFSTDETKGVLNFAAELLERIPKTSHCICDVTLFAHWHIDPYTAETSFGRCQREIIGNRTIGEAFQEMNDGIGIVRFKSFAVSSLRDNLFDLQSNSSSEDAVIEVPSSEKQLVSLIKKFERNAKKDADAIAESKSANVQYKPAELKNLRGKRFLLITAIDGKTSQFANGFSERLKENGADVYLIKDIGTSCYHTINLLYPIFVGTKSWLDSFGATPPEEFAIEISDNGKNIQQCVQSLACRIAIWEREKFLSVGTENVLQGWCAGAFRLFCMLGKTAHTAGAVGSINPFLPKSQYEDFWMNKRSALGKRANGCDGMGWQVPLWNVLYNNEMQAFRKATNGSADNFFTLFKEQVIVSPSGKEVAYSSPTHKINVLLIDDDADDSQFEGIKDVFSVTPLRVVICGKKGHGKQTDFSRGVKAIESQLEGKSYDAILLDLHLGDCDDPAGYQLIRLLKILLPTIPIIVYSRYDDMGHIARAFKMGAAWYIKKDEIYKLPRHFISLLTSSEWRKEWKSIADFGLCSAEKNGDFVVEECAKKSCFLEQFGQERKYLTYKVLERFPGRKMYLRPMSGGFSTAATFRVLKKNDDDPVFYQSPVIVKIDREFYTRTEFERYYRFIRPYIANESGRVENNAVTIDANNSAIVYTFAGKCGSSNELLTLRDMLEKDIMNLVSCRYDCYEKMLDDLFQNILPRIHSVPPPSSNGAESMCSSYPNHAFGERDASDAGFVANYRVRMPLSKHYEVTEFFDVLAATGEGDVIPFEFKDVTDNECIEALELKDESDGAYSKMTVILSGEIVRHVVRFRAKLLIPGKKLFAKVKDLNANIQQEDLRDNLSKALSGNSGYARALFDQEKSKSEGGQVLPEECYFINLFESFAGISKSVYSFDTIVKNLYLHAMEIINNNPKRFSCREGIVHGDLNFANIMLDRRNGDSGGFDVWLIDFARTRRDVIAHDFNVFFTATLAQLFRNELWYDDRQIDHLGFAKKLLGVFHKFAVDVIFGDVSAVGGLSDVPPDYVANDRRLKMVYQILRRVRKAAVDAKIGKDGANQEDVYAMTTALCCLYTFRIFLKHEKSVQGAAALLAIAHLCLERLEKQSSDQGCSRTMR